MALSPNAVHYRSLVRFLHGLEKETRQLLFRANHPTDETTRVEMGRTWCFEVLRTLAEPFVQRDGSGPPESFSGDLTSEDPDGSGVTVSVRLSAEQSRRVVDEVRGHFAEHLAQWPGSPSADAGGHVLGFLASVQETPESPLPQQPGFSFFAAAERVVAAHATSPAFEVLEPSDRELTTAEHARWIAVLCDTVSVADRILEAVLVARAWLDQFEQAPPEMGAAAMARVRSLREAIETRFAHGTAMGDRYGIPEDALSLV